MTTVETILLAPTPASWVDHAAANWRELLVDHANCEKKAASTALALMVAYPEDRKLSAALSRLAREELRHFEQVQRMMDGSRAVTPRGCARSCARRIRDASWICF
jgi:tRNA-(ms[2]io[6]A)-hydroxylase